MALDLATVVWPDDFLRTKPELFFFHLLFQVERRGFAFVVLHTD